MPKKTKVLNQKAWGPSGDLAMRRLAEPFFNPSLSDNLQKRVRFALDNAGILKYRNQIEERLINAIAQAIDYKTHPYKSYNFKKLTKVSFGTSRTRGPRQKELVRFYLMHALFSIWRKYFQIEPTISRKIVTGDEHTQRSPFVSFAHDILLIAGIRKVEDNLTRYRSYEKATLKGLSYEEWVQECKQKTEQRASKNT
jgi:hypothetical protein